MNILAQYAWIKEYLKRPVSADEWSRRMSLSSMSVEHQDDLAERFAHMCVGKILEVKPHPNADRLRVVLVDLGHKKEEIVCGGKNLEVGHLVAVAMAGARVRWHGEGELVELGLATIRGVKSAGMICAPEEIGFEKVVLKGEGPMIWDVTDLTDAKPGTPLAEALNLEGALFDLEVTTNRPDAMSIVGLAREASAIGLGTFSYSPPALPKPPKEKLSFSVDVKDKRCLRYQAIVLDSVKVGPSPWWLQARLLLAGHRPINNIVDITNYVLHEYGQPMHAFDYDKLAGQKIVVRAGAKGESIEALDGKTYDVSGHLVIADGKNPVAVAGVMGGEVSGTTQATTRVVFECACFDPVAVRKTSRALALKSDSQLLFEKGLSPEALPAALARAVELAEKIAGARVASVVFDERSVKAHTRVLTLVPEKVNEHIGVEIPEKRQKEILASLGCALKNARGGYAVTVPYWRARDMEDDVDLSEEIARVYGYHNLPSVLPPLAVAPQPSDARVSFAARIKLILANSGLTEAYQYSFANEKDFERWGSDAANAVAILNPLSDEHTHLRLSLVPSMLQVIERNQGTAGTGWLFELANVYVARKDDLPVESPRLVVAGFGGKDLAGLKGILERLFDELGISSWKLEGAPEAQWHASKGSAVSIGSDVVGNFGEIRAKVQEAFGVQGAVVVFDLDVALLAKHSKPVKHFVGIAAFPSVKRDLAFVINRETRYGDVEQALRKSSDLLRSVEAFDVYEGKGIEKGKKSLAVHLEFRLDDRTLTSAEVDGALSTITKMLQDRFSATIRS